MRKQTRHTETEDSRTGGATVEFALCLPLIILLVFGSIEAANAIFLRQGLSIAAYETAQLASQSGATWQTADARGQSLLTARDISGFAIDIAPQVNTTTPTGTTVVVTVTAPIDANSLGPAWYFRNMTIRSVVTMRRL